MKIKNVMLLVAVLGLTACGVRQEPVNENVSENYKLPAEMSDCKIFNLKGADYTNLTVMRCPYSTTTTKMPGRTQKKVTVEDETAMPKEIMINNHVYSLKN